MNTDKSRERQIMAEEVPETLGKCSISEFFSAFFSLHLSVFISVHPWFHRLFFSL
jgi:hypothetical protein